MSEPTPETSESTSSDHEPSMEDILSSIRQVIEDDDAGVSEQIEAELAKTETEAKTALEPTALVESVDLSEDTEPEAINPLDILEGLSGDDSADDLEIPEFVDEPVAEIEVQSKAPAAEETPVESDTQEAMAPEIQPGDDEVLVLEEILETEDKTVSPLDFVGKDTDSTPDELVGDIDLIVDDVDALLQDSPDDMLELTATDETAEAVTAEAPAQSIRADKNVAGETDIDLVKSLMADLTDDDMHDDGDDLSLDDFDDGGTTQLPSGSAFLAIARQATATAIAVEEGEDFVDLDVPEAASPAKDIAPQKPAETRPVDTTERTDIPQAEDDLEIWVVEVDEDETADPAQTLEPAEIESQETTDMARAAEKESILDNETESETVSAFASLAQVVQEKENNANLGPYVGELVTEALRPMLKEWLDKNLKGIVERAVNKEVKRISGGK